MKGTLLFLLAMFGCCCTVKCRIVSKCELRNQLMQIATQLKKAKEVGLTEENFVANIVCHAEQASYFNTRAVKELVCETNTPEQMVPQRPPPIPHPLHDCEVETLYGLFQLSSRLACRDGTNQLPSICMIDCNDLLDNNPHDDIDCLLKLFINLLENGFGAPKGLHKLVQLIEQEDCWHKKASEYFSEC